MKHEHLEEIYAALATRIDEVGEAHSELLLAKLALLLAEKNGDVEEVLQCIDAAAASSES